MRGSGNAAFNRCRVWVSRPGVRKEVALTHLFDAQGTICMDTLCAMLLALRLQCSAAADDIATTLPNTASQAAPTWRCVTSPHTTSALQTQGELDWGPSLHFQLGVASVTSHLALQGVVACLA